MTPDDLADVLERAFSRRRPTFAREAQLQDRIVDDLRQGMGSPTWGEPLYPIVTREHRLGGHDRLDVFVRRATEAGSPGIAVEVKTAGGLPDVAEQLLRYAEHDEVTGILLVTTKSAHLQIPGVLLGKPCRVLCISHYLL